MDDKIVKQNITSLWNKAYVNYDECYAHGLKSEEEKTGMAEISCAK